MSAIQQLLTDHIDIWTAAETEKKSGRGRASGNASSVYGIRKLRELILELAMQGKLVPQDASDEPASELLKFMNIEKAKLIASGKIKKGKSPSVIFNKEIPYKIPNSWEWMRLPDSYYPIPVSGNQLLSSDIRTSGSFPVIDQGQRFVAGYTDDENLLIRIPGPVIVFGDHTTARKYIDFDFVAGADGVKILRPIAINERFFWLQLVSLKLEGRGYARHYKVLNDCLFAVPPILEQTRIVAKIDELMDLCDRLEAQHSDAADAHEQLVSHLLGTLTQSQSAAVLHTNWQRMAAHFDTLFTTEASIDALKQTLLQLAVMGKLVAQDANDEPARELLKRVQAEKARLISDVKAKKAKPFPKIAEDRKIYNQPRGWEIINFGQIIELISGQHLNPSEYFETTENDSIPYITGPADFSENGPIPTRHTRERRAIACCGDILVTVKGSGVGKTNSVFQDELAISRQLMAIRPILVNINFVDKLLLTLAKVFQDSTVGIAIPGISREDVLHAQIALPPLAEQLRIVSKIEKLIEMCDQLRTRIIATNQQQKKLADVLVEHAVIG